MLMLMDIMNIKKFQIQYRFYKFDHILNIDFITRRIHLDIIKYINY